MKLAYQFNRREERRRQGLCLRCSNPLSAEDKDKNHTSCSVCRQKMREAQTQRVSHRRNQKLCLICGEPAVVRGRTCLCKDCWFTDIAKGRTGTRKNWLLIKKLLERQNYRCAYTGGELTIGQNASLDHIIPTAKGGDNSIENLQWVDLQINVMKNNMSHQEFISTIKLILARRA